MNVLLLDAKERFDASRAREFSDRGARVVEHCVTLQSALHQVTASHVDVIVVDPEPWGPCAIAQLQAVAPHTPVLAMTAQVELEYVLACLEAGAAGYLTKPIDPSQFVRALRDAIEGLTPLSADVGKLLLPLLRNRRSPVVHGVDLTDRERNVLGLLVNGHAYADIADALGIGVGTVQSHVKNLYRKLNVCSKAEAATIAVEQGLLRRTPERRRARSLT
jgi:two-component system nitrate/nitrite response regulator NarL